MVINLASILLVWLACLLSYLASNQQRLLVRPLSKQYSWMSFALILGVAFYLLSTKYLVVVSGLILLIQVMCIWLVIVFSASHFPKKLVSLNLVVLLFFGLIALTAGN